MHALGLVSRTRSRRCGHAAEFAHPAEVLHPLAFILQSVAEAAYSDKSSNWWVSFAGENEGDGVLPASSSKLWGASRGSMVEHIARPASMVWVAFVVFSWSWIIFVGHARVQVAVQAADSHWSDTSSFGISSMLTPLHVCLQVLLELSLVMALRNSPHATPAAATSQPMMCQGYPGCVHMPR